MQDPNRQMAGRIAEQVAQHGGRVYYVGGLVRDGLLGRESKDVDIEVHGITPEVLEGILDSLGQRTSTLIWISPCPARSRLPAEATGILRSLSIPFWAPKRLPGGGILP